jgi:ABC-type Fe3+/spermidine/putrescine transport system ATPase subunit
VLQQCATPLELVQRPATAFVARFVLGALPLPALWRGDRLETALGWLEPAPSRSAPSQSVDTESVDTESAPSAPSPAATPVAPQMPVAPQVPAAPQVPPPPAQRRSEGSGVGEPAASAAAGERLQRSGPAQPAEADRQRSDHELQVLLRPTDLSFAPKDETRNPQAGQDDEVEVLGREFLGRDWLYLVQHRLGRLRVRQPLSVQLSRGERRRLQLASDGEPLLYPAALPLRPCDPAIGVPVRG